MNSSNDSAHRADLDGAIKLLYRGRPAKVAGLLGLTQSPSTYSFSLETKQASYGGMRGNPIPFAQGPNLSNPSGFSQAPDVKSPIKMDKGDNQAQMNQVAGQFDTSAGPKPITMARNPASNSIAMANAPDGSIKQAMSEAELLHYYGGAGDLMEAQGDPSLTPSQLAAMGGGGIGLTAANRMRARNTAARELRGIRKEYLRMVQEGALDKQKLKYLNKELKLRGAKPHLSLAPTTGIADAQMLRSERDLAKSISKKRYRGALPFLAASLLGTIAYNKLNEV